MYWVHNSFIFNLKKKEGSEHIAPYVFDTNDNICQAATSNRNVTVNVPPEEQPECVGPTSCGWILKRSVKTSNGVCSLVTSDISCNENGVKCIGLNAGMESTGEPFYKSAQLRSKDCERGRLELRYRSLWSTC